MRISNLKRIKSKNLIVFDLDGTLIRTKSPMDSQMAGLVARLLAVKKVAVIGGGKYGLFESLFLRRLKAPRELLKNLFLFPTTATSFYAYKDSSGQATRNCWNSLCSFRCAASRGVLNLCCQRSFGNEKLAFHSAHSLGNKSGWKKIYALYLSGAERKKIKKAFQDVFEKIDYKHPKKVYGKVIEDRGTQVTFSALGQDVVAVLGEKRGVALKEKWLRENRDIKMRIAKLLTDILPEFEVRAAGFTSIDVTKKGIDKGYGLRQIEKYLHERVKNMLFIGDAIFPGGNDYGIVRTGVDYIPVAGPAQTKDIIRALLKNKSKRIETIHST